MQFGTEGIVAPDFGDPSSATFEDGFDANRHKFFSSNGEFIYHVALIDYLQAFNLEKWGESRFKIWILRRNPALISAVEPDKYGERFIRFMKTEVFIDSNLFDPDEEF